MIKTIDGLACVHEEAASVGCAHGVDVMLMGGIRMVQMSQAWMDRGGTYRFRTFLCVCVCVQVCLGVEGVGATSGLRHMNLG